MKIALVNTLYEPYSVGGAEKVVRSLAVSLPSHGHEAIVLTTYPGRGTETCSIDGVKTFRIGLKNVYWPFGRPHEPSSMAKVLWHGIDRYNPAMGRAVADILEAERADVVHTHNLAGLSCAVWARSRASGLPIVHTIHDFALACPSATMHREGRNCVAPCASCTAFTGPRRRHSARVTHVVGVSGHVLERHRSLGFFEGVRGTSVIHNGIDGEPVATPSSRDTSDRLRLGFVGRLDPSKGIGWLLDTLHGFEPGRWELLVAGRGAPDYERALIDRHAGPQVRFLGHVDPAEVYRQIDLLVVPSLWQEPMGLIVPEAYFHGVPVLAAARGGLPELVDDGLTGFLFDPDAPRTLLASLRRMLDAPAALAALRPNALAKANAFRLDGQVARYAALYATLRDARAQRSGHR